MRDVYIAGVGMTPVGEHWELSLANLSSQAMRRAIRDAGGITPQALYVGSFLAHTASQQANLGALLASNAGLDYVETMTAEAAEASGAAALRLGYLAVRSGFVNAALVVGVEKYTDKVGSGMDAVIAQGGDTDFEGTQGLTPSGQAAMLAQRYMESYQVAREALAGLPLLAHANARFNPLAMFQREISLEDYLHAPLTDHPLNLLDAAPYADGAAALMLVSKDLLPQDSNQAAIRIAASSVSTDTLALHDRPDALAFNAVNLSINKALSQAGMDWDALQLFELWDAFSIYGLLAIEACGLAAQGQGWRWVAEHDHSPSGMLPLLTMGGNKARGFPLGAAGVYQAAEAVQQLRGECGHNQVPHAASAMIQALGGPAATAITHILTRV